MEKSNSCSVEITRKEKFFWKITHTTMGVKPVGYKWVLVRERNEKNEIVRSKSRLIAQGFFPNARD